jgi:membrane-associated protein
MREFLATLVDLILHVDTHLQNLTMTYDNWVYLILFVVVFVETGLVVTPFLPGDSLLFAAGALAALGALHVGWLWLLLVVAAIAGDTVNYWFGQRIGARAFDGRFRFLKPEHLERTEQFFERHGGKAVLLARFVPLVRTFAPFVAGMGAMHYGRFITFNITGALSWVSLFLLGGYFFGGLPIVQENFHLIVPAIILLSLVPIVVEFVRARRPESAQMRAGSE